MKQTDKLTYTRILKSREAQKIEFELPIDMTISEYKTTCKRLALALGYSNSSVIEHFGVDAKTGDPNQLKLLFD